MMKSESRSILKHAMTILWGQWAVMSFGLIDAAVAGRYDTDALAALSIGTSIYITIYVTLMAVLQVTLPIFSEHLGAGRQSKLAQLVIQSCWIWLALSIAGTLALCFPDALMRLTQVPEQPQALAKDYLLFMAMNLPLVLLFRLFASLCQSLGTPQLVTKIQILALILKVPLAMWFTFGGWGLTPMGLMGCALSTLLIQSIMLAFAAWAFTHHEAFIQFDFFKQKWRIDGSGIREIIRLGIPNAITSAVEVSSFTMMALFIARMGPSATASHQIAASMAAFIFMIPMALSVAASARFSYWIGAKETGHAREVLHIAYAWIIRLGLATASIFWLGSALIAQLFSSQDMVTSKASEMLVLVGFFHLGDALQVMGFFLLRSLRVTWTPMLVYTATLWGVGLMGGYQLAYGSQQTALSNDPSSFWYCSAIAMMISGLALGGLLIRAIDQSALGKTQRKT